MNRTHLLATLALAMTTLSPAQQGPSPYLGANITRTYTLDDLMNRPGLIQLGKGDMVILDMPGDVTAVVTPQGAMMDIPAPLGNVVVITSKVSTGKAQLLIQLDSGRYASFAFAFGPGGAGMKRVLVTDPARIEYAQPSAPAQGGAMPAYSAPATGAPITVTPAAPRSAAPTLPDLGVARPAVMTRAQPEWLLASLKLNRTTLGDNLAVTVTNVGTRPVTFEKDATLTVNGQQLRGAVVGNLTLAPGSSANYLLSVPGSVEGAAQVAVDWVAFDALTNTAYHVTPRE